MTLEFRGHSPDSCRQACSINPDLLTLQLLCLLFFSSFYGPKREVFEQSCNQIHNYFHSAYQWGSVSTRITAQQPGIAKHTRGALTGCNKDRKCPNWCASLLMSHGRWVDINLLDICSILLKQQEEYLPWVMLERLEAKRVHQNLQT